MVTSPGGPPTYCYTHKSRFGDSLPLNILRVSSVVRAQYLILAPTGINKVHSPLKALYKIYWKLLTEF